MVVVGAGRVGGALKRQADQRGIGCELVGRGQAVVGHGAIVLAVRTEQLVDAVGTIPPARHPDLVLVQNGAYHSLLGRFGLDAVTRGVLYVLATGADAELVASPQTAFSGPHADAVVGWFGSLGIPSRSLDPDPFRAVELEKLLWLTINGPLCERHHATVGEIEQDHADEVEALLAELATVGEVAWNLRLDRVGALERAREWSRTIPGYRASVKERSFRNGWFQQAARRYDLALPLHDALLG